jgi:hypothetical protein
MTVIEQILEGIKNGRALYEKVPGSFHTGAPGHNTPSLSRSVRTMTCAPQNELRLGDNFEYMKELMARGYAGSFRMIYIDPPFFTRSSFNASLSVKDSAGSSHKVHHLAYDDKFDRDLAYYIENMTVRLLLMRDLLLLSKRAKRRHDLLVTNDRCILDLNCGTLSECARHRGCGRGISRTRDVKAECYVRRNSEGCGQSTATADLLLHRKYVVHVALGGLLAQSLGK